MYSIPYIVVVTMITFSIKKKYPVVFLAEKQRTAFVYIRYTYIIAIVILRQNEYAVGTRA